MRKVLTENIVSLTLLQVLTYGAPLVTVPYLVRVLQPEHYGLISFAQAIVLYCDFITDYGFSFSATRSIAVHREDSAYVSRIFWVTTCAKGVLMLATGLTLSLLVTFIPRLHQTPHLYAVCFLSVLGTAIFPVWLFQGLEQIKLSAIAFGAARLLTLPLLFAFVRGPRDYLAAAGIQATVEVVAAMIAAPFVFGRFKVRWYCPSWSDIRGSLQQTWVLFLSGSALFLCTSSTAVILGFTTGRAQVGYYTAAEKLIKACIAALSPLLQALYPHITATRAASRVSALRLIRKSLVATACLSLAVSLATLLLAGPVCRVFLGASFAPSVALLRWMSPLPVLFGLMSVLGTHTMLVFEMDSLMSRIMLAGACAGLPVTLAMSIALGPKGAAAASVLVAGFIVAAMIAALHVRGLSVWQDSTANRSMIVALEAEG